MKSSVLRVESAILGFMDPFDPPPEVNPEFLYRISSGRPVPQAIQTNVFRAKPAGKAAKQKFIRDRLNPQTKCKRFYDPVKKLKLKTMGDVKPAKKTSLKDSHSITYAEQTDFFLQALAKSQILDIPISFDQLMTYSVNDVPSAFGIGYLMAFL